MVIKLLFLGWWRGRGSSEVVLFGDVTMCSSILFILPCPEQPLRASSILSAPCSSCFFPSPSCSVLARPSHDFSISFIINSFLFPVYINLSFLSVLHKHCPPLPCISLSVPFRSSLPCCPSPFNILPFPACPFLYVRCPAFPYNTFFISTSCSLMPFLLISFIHILYLFPPSPLLHCCIPSSIFLFFSPSRHRSSVVNLPLLCLLLPLVVLPRLFVFLLPISS